MIGAENPDVINILEDLAIQKRNKIIKKLSATDADSIFDLIEVDNPLNSRGPSKARVPLISTWSVIRAVRPEDSMRAVLTWEVSG